MVPYGEFTVIDKVMQAVVQSQRQCLYSYMPVYTLHAIEPF
jgi:hypothetical protein